MRFAAPSSPPSSTDAAVAAGAFLVRGRSRNTTG